MTNVSFEKRLECGLTKSEYVTGSNKFSEEKITEYYWETCATTHMFNGKWLDLQSENLYVCVSDLLKHKKHICTCLLLKKN